jgi:hypothetical protein
VLAGIALSSLIFQKNSSIARSIIFALGAWLAPLFYITYIIMLHRLSFEILGAFFVECAILGFYCILFSSLFSIVSNKDLLNPHLLMQWLQIGTLLVVALGLQLIFAGNFGIFSEGASRNEYIGDSKWFLYSGYASALIQTLMIPVIAALLNCTKKWNKLIIFYLCVVLVLSVLIGSKGGGVLTMFAILSLLKLQSAKDYVRLLWLPFIAIAVTIISTAFILGSFLSLEPIQMISLMFARVFLNNDARALAIDFGGLQDISLFRESFRSVATFLGIPSVNPALGQYLYTQAFNSSGYVGANTSSTALMIAYGGAAEKTVFSLLLCIVAATICVLARVQGKYAILRVTIGIELLLYLSQDFLAFQLLTNLLVIVSLCLALGLLFRHLLIGASKAPLAL